MTDEKQGKKRKPAQGAPLIDEQLVKIVDTLPAPSEFAERMIEAVPSAQGNRIYLKEIARFPVLSESEELAVVKVCQDKNDRQARKKLNEANIRLVAWIAKEYAGGETQLPDLINEGTLGLSEAVDTFDPQAGKSFRLHAAATVRRAISESVAYETSITRIPDYLLEKVESIKPVSQRLMNEMGREPTRDEVAVELGLSADELDRLVKLVGHAPGNEEKSEEDSDDEESDGTDFYDVDSDYD